MLVTNGVITRNIAEKQLNEYTIKGYEEVAEVAKEPIKAPSKPAKKKAGDK